MLWLAGVVTSVALQTQPVVAAGNVNVPVEPQVAPPIRISKAAVPLLAEIVVLDAVEQNPEAIVGAVPDAIAPGSDAPVPPNVLRAMLLHDVVTGILA